MQNEICVYLSPVAAQYLAEVLYSLDYGEGQDTTTAEAINHCLEELAAYEWVTDDQVTNHLMEKYPNRYKEWLEINRSKLYKQKM